MRDKNKFKTSLSVEELLVYNIMEQLPINLKYLLNSIIKNADKNHVSVFRGNRRELEELIMKELVTINDAYHPYGNEISLIVLPNAQTLINKLKYCKELNN